MPEWIGCYALAEGGGLVLVALRTGLFASLHDPRRFWFDDGRCDQRGCFHVGPVYAPLGLQDDQAYASNMGPAWRDDGLGEWRPATPPMRFSNGLARSPDRRTMYHAHTVNGGGDSGGPDGACADRDGFYICAVFGAGAASVVDPRLPSAKTISSPLYVTSVSFPIPSGTGDPGAGGLFALEAAAPGLPEAFSDPLSKRARHEQNRR